MTTFMVADDFSTCPGGRFIQDGDFSGELFQRDFLAPRLRQAIKAGELLSVNFDGVVGLPTSFAEEGFGGLVRNNPDLSSADIKKFLKIEAPNSPKLWGYIQFAQNMLEKALQRRTN